MAEPLSSNEQLDGCYTDPRRIRCIAALSKNDEIKRALNEAADQIELVTNQRNQARADYAAVVRSADPMATGAREAEIERLKHPLEVLATLPCACTDDCWCWPCQARQALGAPNYGRPTDETTGEP